MTAPTTSAQPGASAPQLSADPLALCIAGRAHAERARDVRSPYTGQVVGRVATCTREDVHAGIGAMLAARISLSRHERSVILRRAADLLDARAETLARQITAETGLCLRDTRIEPKRAAEVLRLCAAEALVDDGRAYAGDVTPPGVGGKARRVFTMRQPLRCVAAITPFNHPINTVAHKIGPAIAAGAPLILKPSEKAPLSGVTLAHILYEAGLPREMLSVVLGDGEQAIEVARALVTDPRVEAVTFTGSTAAGLEIARTAGYKKIALEMGGNSELIVLRDADLDLAATLACEGAFRNSGQRCTAAKRLLVDRSVVGAFTERLLAAARAYRAGDPMDDATMVGTVIDEPSAVRLEQMIAEAVRMGARLLLGGSRRGALLEPTVLADVPRSAPVFCQEAFGPIAKVVAVDGLDDAIALANTGDYGLSTSVVTQNLAWATRVIHEVRTGNVNVNDVPGYRTEHAPFGGVKLSGLGVKEGVVEATRWMSSLKTFSLPWA